MKNPRRVPSGWLVTMMVLLGAVSGAADTITVDGGGGAQYTTIQAAIDDASSGDTIVIAAGTYVENPVINKRLHLIGAGDKMTGTIIQGHPSRTTVLKVTRGGTSETERLVLEGIRVTGGRATTPGGNTGAGIELATGVGHVLLRQVTCSGNDGHGFDFNATAPVSDVHLESCTFVENKGAGVRIPQSLPSLNSFSLIGSTIADNEGIGALFYSQGVTDVLIESCRFERNNSNGATGGDLVLSGFTGDAVFADLFFESENADSSIRMSGTKNSDKTPKGPAGRIVFRDITIAGTQAGTYPGAAIAISRYTDGSKISFENVVLASAGAFGMHLGTIGGTMDLAGVTFDGEYTTGDLYLGRHGEQSGTGNSYPFATVLVKTSGEAFARASDPFAIEDLVHHALDDSRLGLVVWNPNNVYVTTGSGRIQRGIDAASDGWTVHVAEGTYPEVLAIGKALTLQGRGGGNRPKVVLPDTNEDGITVTGDGVTLGNLWLYREGHSSYRAIIGVPKGGSYPDYTIDTRNLTIQDCLIEGGRYSMYVSVEDMTVQGCTFKEPYRDGIVTAGIAGTLTITHNHFIGIGDTKQAIYMTTGPGKPYDSGTLSITYNTHTGGGHFLLIDYWGWDEVNSVDLRVVHNSIDRIGERKGVVFYVAYAKDPQGFPKFNSIAIQDNLFSNCGPAVYVDYQDWGGAPPADVRTVPADAQIVIHSNLTHSVAAGADDTMDATGAYGYYDAAGMTPSGASLPMFDSNSNIVGDPLYEEANHGGMSLESWALPPGSPARRAASDGTDIGAWQGPPNALPVADANGPYSGYVSVPIAFDAAASYDPDGAVVLYEWDFDGDGAYDASTTDPAIAHAWPDSYAGSVGLRVTDDGGLTATAATTVRVLGARDLKEEALDELNGLLPTGGHRLDKKLDKAIEHIQKSLNIDPKDGGPWEKHDLWLDDNHLDPKHGGKAFNEEKLAVKQLMELVKKDDTPQAVRDACQAIIDKLVMADCVLARTVRDEAQADTDNPKMDRELEKCNKELESAFEELNHVKKDGTPDPRYDKAIDHYKKAWEHACKARETETAVIKPHAIADELTVVAYPNPIRDVHTATFQVMGALAHEVEEIRVQIYDLSRRLVWERAARGNELDWHTESLSGDYLANGIYLYLVQVRIDGSWIHQDVGKIAVLR